MDPVLLHANPVSTKVSKQKKWLKVVAARGYNALKTKSK